MIHPLYLSRDKEVSIIKKTHTIQTLKAFTLKTIASISAIIFMSSQATATTTIGNLENNIELGKNKFSLSNSLNLSSNVQEVHTIDNQSDASLGTQVSYKLNDLTSLGLSFSFFKSFQGEERFDLLNSSLYVRTGLNDFANFNHTLTGTITLPTHFYLNEKTSFVTALTGRLTSSRNISSRMSLSLANSLRWNFHVFRVSETASPNIQASYTPSFSLNYELLKKLSLSPSVSWTLAKSYKNIFKAQYSINLGGTYLVTKQTSLSLGYTTADNARAADGRSTNIKFFDERNSSYYMSLSHSY